MSSLRETAEGMAALAPKKGRSHRWWSLAEAMVAVLDSGNEEAIAIAEETYKRKAEDD